MSQFKLTFADAVQSLPLDFVFVHQSHRLVVLHKDQLRPQRERGGGEQKKKTKKKKTAELSPVLSTTGEKSLQNILQTCNHKKKKIYTEQVRSDKTRFF